MIREKLNAALLDYKDINLESCVGREALIDRIINIVQSEPIDPKYWQKTTATESCTWTSAEWVDHMKDYEEHGN